MTDAALIAAIQHYTMLKHDALERLALAVSDITVPGAIVECGVASGGTAAFLWALTGRNRALWMFDSWQGLPAPDSTTDGGRAVSKHIHRMLSYGGAWCRGEIVDVIRALLAVECPLSFSIMRRDGSMRRYQSGRRTLARLPSCTLTVTFTQAPRYRCATFGNTLYRAAW